MKKIGFIGCGNMGEAILSGILQANILSENQIFVHTRSNDNLQRLKKMYGIETCDSNTDVYNLCDYVILAIKPNQFEDVIEELRPIFDEDKVVISIAAGITLAKLEEYFDSEQLKAIRVMPNTPVFVSEGMSAICANDNAISSDLQFVSNIFASIGKAIEVNEEDMHAVVASSGSSPAYVYMFIDAMIQEAMRQGLSYEVAKELSTQSVLGAAKMVLSSDETPSQLKDNVCSPNGTTIEAVNVLEEEKLSTIIAKAMERCANKSRKMSK